MPNLQFGKMFFSFHRSGDVGDAGDTDNNPTSANNSPEIQDGSYLYNGSPRDVPSRRVCRDVENVARDSPIGRYLGSSQYITKKLAVKTFVFSY